VTFRLKFPDGEGGDAARALLPEAVQRSHDRLCTESSSNPQPGGRARLPRMPYCHNGIRPHSPRPRQAGGRVSRSRGRRGRVRLRKDSSPRPAKAPLYLERRRFRSRQAEYAQVAA